MSADRLARLVGRLIGLVVLIVSGAYLLIYLYRWEWNRALVAGIFFVSAEVAIASGVILSRLRAIEDHLARGGGASPVSATAPPERRSPFAWLRPDPNRMGVFIPVLLGAGVILSTLAFLVERIARFTAAPVAEHDLASRLATLAPATEGLVPPVGAAPEPAPAVGDPGTRRGRDPLHRAALWVTVVVVVVGAGIGIDALRDATMSTPEPVDENAVLVLTLDVDTREAFGSVDDLVEALYVDCRVRLPNETRLIESAETPEAFGRLVVAPALGSTTQRRFVGCLEDATIDRVNAEVVTAEQVALEDLERMDD